jgi:hypothetical protein
MQGYVREVKRILAEHGCKWVRNGKGDHEIWESPINGLRFPVDRNMPSRHTANAVLKQAGIDRKL